MKRIPLKEFLLLLLPALLLLGASFWWQKREKRDAIKESGPFRLEVAKIEKVTPKPAEVAEGYDTKFLVTFAYRGNDPLAVYRRDDLDSDPSSTAYDVKLLEKDHKQWRSIPLKTSPRVMVAGRQFLRHLNENQIAVLLAFSKLPETELRVQFSASKRVSYLVPKGSIKPRGRDTWFFSVPKEKKSDGVSINYKRPNISIPVRKAGETAPNPQVSHQRSISLQGVKVAHYTPLFAATFDGYSNADIQVEIAIQKQVMPQENPLLNRWEMINGHIVDDNGKRYDRWPVPFSKYDLGFEKTEMSLPPTQSAGDGIYRIRSRFSTSFIPISAGQLTFKAQISVNDEWPMPVSIIIRRRDDWKVKKSRTLQLKSIDVEQDPANPLKYNVRVKVTYNGTFELLERRKKPNLFTGNVYYDQEDSRFTHWGIDYPFIGADEGIRTPNRRLFVTNWSQRIEKTPANTTFGTSPVLRLFGNPAPVKDVSCGADCEVVYAVDLSKVDKQRKPLPENLIFKADIGVEGDGFLPVSIALPIPKKP